jgi:hypothetical protein
MLVAELTGRRQIGLLISLLRSGSHRKIELYELCRRIRFAGLSPDAAFCRLPFPKPRIRVRARLQSPSTNATNLSRRQGREIISLNAPARAEIARRNDRVDVSRVPDAFFADVIFFLIASLQGRLPRFERATFIFQRRIQFVTTFRLNYFPRFGWRARDRETPSGYVSRYKSFIMI